MKKLNADPILQQIVTRLSESIPAKRIYLFGSQVTGPTHQDPDYDFLVLVQDSEKNRVPYLIDKGHRSLKGIKAFVDIVVMTESQFREQLDVINSIPETIRHESVELYAS